MRAVLVSALLFVCAGLFGWLPILPGLAQETKSVIEQPEVGLVDTNFQQTLQAIVALEGHLRASQTAIEQNGKETRELAARNAEMLSNGLHSIQNALADQQKGFSAWRTQEVELLQSSNRATLLTGGTFAGIAALAVLMIAFFQWRMSKAWTGIANGFSLRGSNGSAALSAVPVDTSSPVLSGLAADSNRRLLGTMEQLERRILQLEELSGAPLQPVALVSGAGDNGHSSAGSGSGTGSPGSEPGPVNDHGRITALLRQGKSLLKENHLEAAISRFDEILSLSPNHGEALLKKGTALEKLQKLNEALECYDRAVAAHDSMALAYLHKGGLYNRLERFKEALECYEKALHTHEERHG